MAALSQTPPPPDRDKSLWIVLAILVFVVPLGFFVYLRLKGEDRGPGLFPRPAIQRPDASQPTHAR